MDFTALTHRLERRERYIKNNIFKEFQALPPDANVAAINVLLKMLESEYNNSLEIFADMNKCKDAKEDAIDTARYAFERYCWKLEADMLELRDSKTSNTVNPSNALLIEVDDLKTKLNGIGSFISEINTEQPPSISILQHRANQLSQVEAQLDAAFKQLRVLSKSKEDSDNIVVTKQELDSRICEFYSKLFDLIDKLQAAQKKSSHKESHSSQKPIKLEAVKIPDFSGEPREWITFRDKFSKLIHENDDLADVSKYHYLQSLIKDKNAPACIKNAPATDEGYQDAWKTVLKTYDNDRLLLQTNFDAIMKIKSMNEENPTDMQRILTEIQSCVDFVERMETCDNPFSALIAHIAIFRIDKHSRDLYETLNGSKIPTWESLSEFLLNRSKTLASLASNSRSAPRQAPAKNTFSSNQKPVKAFNASTPQKHPCKMCNSTSHYIGKCPTFDELPAHVKLQKIRSLSLCENCFGAHALSNCPSNYVCRQCKQTHHSKLHEAFQKSNQHPKKPASAEQQPPTAHAFHTYKMVQNRDHLMSSFVMLATATVMVQSETGSWIPARALIDQGSTACFMTKAFSQKLSLKQIKHHVTGTGMGKTQIAIDRKVRTRVANKDLSSQYGLEFYIQAELTGQIPSVPIPFEDFMVPENLQTKLADPQFNVPSTMDIVIGGIISKKIEIGLPIELNSGIDMQETVFGWTISGGLSPVSSSTVLQSNVFAYTLHDLKENIEKFWKLEDYRTDKRFLTHEETFCEQHFEQNVQRLPNGRFQVTIPFNENFQLLENNRNAALAQLLRMERVLERKPDYRQQYEESMQDFIESGDMRLVDTSKDDPNVLYIYLPHHGVVKQDSTTTKLRVVFNASSKTASGISLNECQRIGPKVQIDSADLLVKTRFFKYMAKADIGKMFRKINVHPDQTRLQRVLWRDPADGQIKTYELTTVTFGQAASPFLATRCVKQLAIENINRYPEAARILLENTYVDDVFFGANSVKQLLAIARDLITTFASAGMELRKFSSNSEGFMEQIPPAAREHPENYITTYKALGVLWDTKADLYGLVPPVMSESPFTKRNVLSQIAGIFDPIGLIGPVTFRFKLFMQDVYKAKTGWDEPLPNELMEPWQALISDTKFIPDNFFPRYALVDLPCNIQLHGFSDASNVGYGAAIYVRSENEDGEVQSHLIFSKSRGSDRLTEIPRLELSSALVSTHVMSRLAKLLHIDSLTYWMDSTIALQWIKKEPAALQPFVAHRVRDIQTISGSNSTWNHISGVDNPADIISRGASAETLPTTIWQHGPAFLCLPQHDWPESKVQFDLSNPQFIKELKTVAAFTATEAPPENPLYTIIRESSSTSRMRRKIAPIMRFIYNTRARALECPKRSQTSLTIFQPTIGDLRDADIAIARIDQMTNLPEEFTALSSGRSLSAKSPLVNLAPIWDKKRRLILVGGRIINASVTQDQRQPIALGNSHLARIIAAETHQHNLHAGQRTTIAFVNQRYWPLRLKSTVRRIIHTCQRCFRLKPKLQEQFMGNLPFERVNPARPFLHTGVDFAGPIMIKTSNLRNAPVIKGYIAVFVCFTTKAIHLECVTALTTEAYLKSHTRMAGRRGSGGFFYCDNGTNFVGARNELNELTAFLKANESFFTDYFAKQGIEWKMNPPRAPHMGGLWEAAVKSAKIHLKATIGTTTLTFEDMSTLLVQIEAILNSRPLTLLNDDPNDPQPLTPAHFLIGTEMIAMPQENLVNEKIPCCKLYRRMQQIQQHFWTRWQREVLREMQKRGKNFKIKIDYKIGQVVLLFEDNSPPLCWPLGIIDQIIPGSDGITRVIHVRLANGKIFSRPTTKIAVLPLPDEYEQNLDSHTDSNELEGVQAHFFQLTVEPDKTAILAELRDVSAQKNLVDAVSTFKSAYASCAQINDQSIVAILAELRDVSAQKNRFDTKPLISRFKLTTRLGSNDFCEILSLDFTNVFRGEIYKANAWNITLSIHRKPTNLIMSAANNKRPRSPTSSDDEKLSNEIDRVKKSLEHLNQFSHIKGGIDAIKQFLFNVEQKKPITMGEVKLHQKQSQEIRQLLTSLAATTPVDVEKSVKRFTTGLISRIDRYQKRLATVAQRMEAIPITVRLTPTRSNRSTSSSSISSRDSSANRSAQQAAIMLETPLDWPKASARDKSSKIKDLVQPKASQQDQKRVVKVDTRSSKSSKIKVLDQPEASHQRGPEVRQPTKPSKLG